MKTFGDNLKYFRKLNKISQKDFADKMKNAINPYGQGDAAVKKRTGIARVGRIGERIADYVRTENDSNERTDSFTFQ